MLVVEAAGRNPPCRSMSAATPARFFLHSKLKHQSSLHLNRLIFTLCCWNSCCGNSYLGTASLWPDCKEAVGFGVALEGAHVSDMTGEEEGLCPAFALCVETAKAGASFAVMGGREFPHG